MPTSPQATDVADPHPAVFSIQAARSLAVQALGMGMVALVGLTVIPWPLVLAWTLTAAAAVTVENRLLLLIARDGGFSRMAGIWAPVVRVLATTIYAVAAYALIIKGGFAQHLFAFALISASLVNVLLRYYRSPPILLASVLPYVVILGSVGFSLARTALAQGHGLAAMVSLFTIAMFVLQFWSARAQLVSSWAELLAAREKAEERERAAESASRAKSCFLATMSHELRTPLNGVLGMAQALSASDLSRAQREQVTVIRRSGQGLLAVLDDLLDFSKIEAGVLELNLAEFDLEHLTRGVVAAYRPVCEKKGLTFDFEVCEAARGRYLGDSARIRRALYSLCDNAAKFTQAGGVTLRVNAEGGQLVFCVADTGIGIADEDLAHLFEEFFQADSTLKRRYGGAGVGLAICSEYTSLMGGVIEAASKFGEGSNFTIRLPLPSVGTAPETPQSEDAPATQAERPAELRVLAAEDNATNQLVLKTLLASAGIVPTMVVNGREAVDAWEAEAWDIILMDIQMPELDGIEATRAIRQREVDSGRARTPIVAVTANAMTHQVADYDAAGFDGVVAKPIEIAKLFAAMDQALEQDEADAVKPGAEIPAA